MLSRLSLSNQIDISPLFIELKELHKNEQNDYDCWLEKARWIRFEEQAEKVIGRWSKPFVTTIPNTAIDHLIDHISNAFMIFDIKNIQDIKQVAHSMGSFFDDKNFKNKFIDLLCLPHLHHHEKKIFKSVSGPNLNKINSLRLNLNMQSVDKISSLSVLENDYIFKENKRFKKKIHNKAEGAAVLVMPIDFATGTQLIFMRLHAATELETFLEVKITTRFVVVILGPIEKRTQLYECGRAFSSCMADDVCRELFYSAHDKLDILEVVYKFKRSTMVIPPSEWYPKIRIDPPERYLSKEDRQKNPELSDFIHVEEQTSLNGDNDITLKGSVTPFFGLVEDIKRKIVFYKSDFVDSLNLKCVASILYMYLVTLCSLVTFGGLLGQETNDTMATVECILAGAICGIIFSLFSGQPLLIITATGPVFILESIIKNLCDTHGLDFLEFRLWVGLWTALLLFLLVMFNLSFLAKFITRFSEECFAGLVSIVFILDALKMTGRLHKAPKQPFGQEVLTANNFSFLKTNISTSVACIGDDMIDSVFYFSILLFIMTLMMCMLLSKIRTKRYLTTKIREIISDFDVLITVLVVSLFDRYMDYSTLKLKIPSQFKPSSRENWSVPFYSGQNQWYTIFMALIPAVLLAILIFFDQQITAVITNRKDMKLKKSHGYHLDLLIVCICLVVCSVLGLPWFAAGTVLTITHINSLKVMSENTAPGERAIYTGVCEQRCTSLIMSILIGLSVLLTNILAYIPVASLYGVFMMMGINLIKNLQFFERLTILFMPAKHQPDLPYLRHISSSRVNLFTVIQLVSTLMLYLVKYLDNVAIMFPILVVATCGIRKIMDCIFTQPELYLLDDILPTKNQAVIDNTHMFENDPTIKFMDSHSRTLSIRSSDRYTRKSTRDSNI